MERSVEADFDPVVPSSGTGEKWVLIRACFHEPDSAYPLHLEVTPKMSFGTGHHATTFLVVQQMGRMDFTGKRSLISGPEPACWRYWREKLGAADILTIDHDTVYGECHGKPEINEVYTFVTLPIQ